MLTISTGTSTLELPVRPPGPDDERLRDFDPPEAAPGSSHKPLRPLPFKRVVERDLTTDQVVYTLSSDGGEFGGHSRARLEEIDLELGYSLVKCHRIAEIDPLSATTEVTQHIQLRRGDWCVRIDGHIKVTARSDHLHFTAELDAKEGDELVRERRWDVKVPRRLF